MEWTKQAYDVRLYLKFMLNKLKVMHGLSWGLLDVIMTFVTLFFLLKKD